MLMIRAAVRNPANREDTADLVVELEKYLVCGEPVCRR